MDRYAAAIGYKPCEGGFLFYTKNLRGGGAMCAGGGTSTTFVETEQRAIELCERFSSAYGVAWK